MQQQSISYLPHFKPIRKSYFHVYAKKFRPFAEISSGALSRPPSPKKVSSICRNIIRRLPHLYPAPFHALPRPIKFRPFAEIVFGILKFCKKKKILVLAGKSAPKIIREDKLAELLWHTKNTYPNSLTSSIKTARWLLLFGRFLHSPADHPLQS